MKKTFLLLMFFFSMKIFAQSNLEEVVYLKNGGIVRGIIIEQIPNEKIKIQTKDGNVFVYKYDEISKLTKEPQLGISSNVYKNNSNDDLRKYKAKGIGLLSAGSLCFGVGFPFLVIGPLARGLGATISGTFLTAASIPMFYVGGVQIKKYKNAKSGGLSLNPNIGVHDQVGLQVNNNAKGLSVGASLRFSF